MATLALPTPAPVAATPTMPEVMTADQLAAFLGLHRQTVYAYAARGAIPHRRIGRRVLFARIHVVAWLNACKASGIGKAKLP